MKKYIYPILVALSALSLAGAAAFFSVTGLSKLFSGAKVEVIIMASALELAKIVTASFLHKYWSVLKWQMKTYLTMGVITVMIITSAGIYGFLSNAYSTTSGKLQNIDAQVQLVEQKKAIVSLDINRLQENKVMKSDRVKSLVNLRTNQETRLDSLYSRRQNSSAKRVEQQIEQANKDIASSNIEIDSLNSQIQRKSTETSKLDMEILDLKTNDTNGEVGPLKYIAKLTGKDMDSVVNFFILLLIFVFDPLAISLVIATNIAIERELGKKEEPKEPEPFIEPVVEPIIEPTIEPTVEPIVIAQEESETQKKTEEVMRYVADENGDFKAIPLPEPEPIIDEEKERVKQLIIDQAKAEGLENNASYLSFLDVLFKGGSIQIGTKLPSYSKFLEEIKAAGLKYVEKEVKDFLTICNLFKITDMSGSEKKIAKDYLVAKDIIALLSK